MVTQERAVELAQEELLKIDWIGPAYIVDSIGMKNTVYAWIVPFLIPRRKKISGLELINVLSF
ncbi:MAG: hypothetical protein V4714_12360 [Bacteroidota bacterium]